MLSIYLINLARAKDRRDYILRELVRLLPEAQVERVKAIDIKSPNYAQPSDYSPGRWNSDRWALGSSDIEIFRSHLDAWRKIAETGRHGIILEDDLLFSDQFGECVRGLIKANAKGIIRLDATGHPALLAPAHSQVGIFKLHQLCSLGASAAAYMLDCDTAARLVAHAKIERTLDDFLFDPYPIERGASGHSLDIIQLEPVVAMQAQFGTFSSSSRRVENFLRVTKRVDVKYRKNKEIIGPLHYRLKKEVLRAKHRRAQSVRIRRILANGGTYCSVKPASDLQWRFSDRVNE